MIEISAS